MKDFSKIPGFKDGVRVATALVKISEYFDSRDMFRISHFDYGFEPDRGADSRGEKGNFAVANPKFEVTGFEFSYDSDFDDGDGFFEMIQGKKLAVFEKMESELWNETVGTEFLRENVSPYLSVNDLRMFLNHC